MEKPRRLPSGTWQQRVTGPGGKRRSALGDTERKAQKAGALLLTELEAKHAANQKLDETTTLFSKYAEEHLWSRRIATTSTTNLGTALDSARADARIAGSSDPVCAVSYREVQGAADAIASMSLDDLGRILARVAIAEQREGVSSP